MPITGLVRKVHIYAGLLTFAHLAIYGIAGLVASVHGGQERPKNAQATRTVSFEVPASATDKEVARRVYETLKLPLTRPIPDWFLRRTPDNHLLLDFYNINGIYRVVVFEDRRELRIEEIRNSLPVFLEDVHAATIGDTQAPKLVRAWALWNELAMWSLLGFCLTGAYLWLATRPRMTWAWTAVVVGALSLGALWMSFR